MYGPTVQFSQSAIAGLFTNSTQRSTNTARLYTILLSTSSHQTAESTIIVISFSTILFIHQLTRLSIGRCSSNALCSSHYQK